MAIIKPSKTFIGSEIGFRDASKYIKPDVRQVTFNKKNNQGGAWLLFLPPYKADARGAGVWYHGFTIRDNFGDKFKEKYVSIPNDPVDHFQRNLKVLYPALAEIKEAVVEGNQTRKVYPLHGRTTKRVIYNVAYLDNLQAGCHVLDLPSYNGASIIDSWLDGVDTRGRARPLLNDPDSSIPVFIKLREGAGAPWQIEPSQGEATVIPRDLADSDNLYNLDDVFIKKSSEELIQKLREMYPAEVFEACMDGYHGFDSVIVASPTPVASPTRAPVRAQPVAVPAIKRFSDEEMVETDYVDTDDIPMAPAVSVEAAKNLLSRPRPSTKLSTPDA